MTNYDFLTKEPDYESFETTAKTTDDSQILNSVNPKAIRQKTLDETQLLFDSLLQKNFC